MAKLTAAQINRERKLLKGYVEHAQYQYNCAVDARIKADKSFEDAEHRLFHFEKVLDEFNKKYPEK